MPLRITIQWDFEAPDGADPEDFRRWVDNAWREHSRQDDPLYDINRMVLGNGQVDPVVYRAQRRDEVQLLTRQPCYRWLWPAATREPGPLSRRCHGRRARRVDTS